MRRIIVGSIMLASAQSAAAADFGDFLRGTTIPCTWVGAYGGVQAGYSSAQVDFTRSLGSLIARILRVTTIEEDEQISQWPIAKSVAAQGVSYGGFVGYNWQWEDVVGGFEINYNHTSIHALSFDTLARSFVDNNAIPAGHSFDYTVAVTGSAAAHLTDWTTLRARGGWADGQFLPYGFLGAAVGRADVTRSVSLTVSAVDYPTPPATQIIDPTCAGSYAICPGTDAAADGQNGAFLYGAAAGLGIDFLVLPHMFLRAEWEYVKFAEFHGVPISVNTARTALGFKF